MLSYKESLKILKETDALLEGHFVISSGLHSDKYVQCAKLLSKPAKARELCLSLAEKIKKEYKNIDLILSPAIGGIVIGYEIGKILNIEMTKRSKDYLQFLFDIQIKDLKSFTNLISQLKQQDLKFTVIRHKKKKYDFIQRVLKNFKRN